MGELQGSRGACRMGDCCGLNGGPQKISLQLNPWNLWTLPSLTFSRLRILRWGYHPGLFRQTLNPMTGVFIRVKQRNIWHRQKRSRQYDHRGRGWSDAAMRNAHSLWKMEKPKKEVPSRASRGSGAQLTPWFQTFGIQKCERMNFFCFKLSVCGNLYGGFWKRMQR